MGPHTVSTTASSDLIVRNTAEKGIHDVGIRERDVRSVGLDAVGAHASVLSSKESDHKPLETRSPSERRKESAVRVTEVSRNEDPIERFLGKFQDHPDEILFLVEEDALNEGRKVAFRFEAEFEPERMAKAVQSISPTDPKSELVTELLW